MPCARAIEAATLLIHCTAATPENIAMVNTLSARPSVGGVRRPQSAYGKDDVSQEEAAKDRQRDVEAAPVPTPSAAKTAPRSPRCSR